VSLGGNEGTQRKGRKGRGKDGRGRERRTVSLAYFIK